MPVVTFASGQRLPAARLNALPKGVVMRAQRTTSSSTTTTEVGVLRLDGVPIVAGRSYRIWTSPLAVHSSAANDVVRARLRVSTSGTATTSSTQLAITQDIVPNTAHPPAPSISSRYDPTSSGTLSVLLTVGRQTGTGNVDILSGSGLEIELVVEDVGLAVSDTGVDI